MSSQRAETDNVAAGNDTRRRSSPVEAAQSARPIKRAKKTVVNAQPASPAAADDDEVVTASDSKRRKSQTVGRAKGSKNYSQFELAMMAKAYVQVKPYGSLLWQNFFNLFLQLRTADNHNHVPLPPRTMEGLRERINRVVEDHATRRQSPTGNPNRPQWELDILRAHAELTHQLKCGPIRIDEDGADIADAADDVLQVDSGEDLSDGTGDSESVSESASSSLLPLAPPMPSFSHRLTSPFVRVQSLSITPPPPSGNGSSSVTSGAMSSSSSVMPAISSSSSVVPAIISSSSVMPDISSSSTAASTTSSAAMSASSTAGTGSVAVKRQSAVKEKARAAKATVNTAIQSLVEMVQLEQKRAEEDKQFLKEELMQLMAMSMEMMKSFNVEMMKSFNVEMMKSFLHFMKEVFQASRQDSPASHQQQSQKL